MLQRHAEHGSRARSSHRRAVGAREYGQIRTCKTLNGVEAQFPETPLLRTETFSRRSSVSGLVHAFLTSAGIYLLGARRPTWTGRTPSHQLLATRERQGGIMSGSAWISSGSWAPNERPGPLTAPVDSSARSTSRGSSCPRVMQRDAAKIVSGISRTDPEVIRLCVLGKFFEGDERWPMTQLQPPGSTDAVPHLICRTGRHAN